MSQATLSGQSHTHAFVSTILPLLKEYTPKLNLLVELCHKEYASPQPGKTNLEQMIKNDQKIFLRTQILHVLPAAEKLASVVSGMINNGRLNEFERAESEMRLAEFEAYLSVLRGFRDGGNSRSG